MTKFRLLALLLAILAPLAWPSSAQAACNRASFCVCTTTATGVAFGNYNPLNTADHVSTGTINVRCTLLIALGASFEIDLSQGSSGSYVQRTMRNGTSSLSYNLYRDPTRTQVWGNGTGGSTDVTYSFNRLFVVDEDFTVYGEIPANQSVASGVYADTIIVTVTY